ncbi:MAG: hypothetical protein K2P10_01375, partial [Oscillospiraceae bacterium]|nr:hypothetical protein [Oscillospiraceae bacterium]
MSKIFCFFISAVYSLFVRGCGRLGRVCRGLWSFWRFRFIRRLGFRFFRGIRFRCVGRFRFLLRRGGVLFRHIGRCDLLGRVLLRRVRGRGFLRGDFLRNVRGLGVL